MAEPVLVDNQDFAPEHAAPSTDTTEAWLRLAFVNLPAGRCNAALDIWGSPQAMLDAAVSGREAALLETSGITPTTVTRLQDAAERNLQPAFEAMQNFGIRLMLQTDRDYPAALRVIPDPPPYIFVRGTVLPQDEVAVAIVGTRHTTEYGRGLAHSLGRDLARRGVTVVSGLARGVDTHAHKGALEGNGRTFAVCGCGLDVAYPTENKNLMQQIAENGACWSEFAPTTHPEAWHFPARNRIISGLSAGVVVVEAAERSGALITADFAMEQGREVFAVPGNVHKAQSRGCHALIRQGATLVQSAEEVLEALNNRALPFERNGSGRNAGALGESQIARKTDERRRGVVVSNTRGAARPPQETLPLPRPDLTETENRVFLALDVEPRHVDEVAVAAQMGAGEANSTLVLLELKNLVRRLPGGMFVRQQ